MSIDELIVCMGLLYQKYTMSVILYCYVASPSFQQFRMSTNSNIIAVGGQDAVRYQQRSFHVADNMSFESKSTSSPVTDLCVPYYNMTHNRDYLTHAWDVKLRRNPVDIIATMQHG